MGTVNCLIQQPWARGEHGLNVEVASLERLKINGVDSLGSGLNRERGLIIG